MHVILAMYLYPSVEDPIPGAQAQSIPALRRATDDLSPGKLIFKKDKTQRRLAFFWV